MSAPSERALAAAEDVLSVIGTSPVSPDELAPAIDKHFPGYDRLLAAAKNFLQADALESDGLHEPIDELEAALRAADS